MFMHVSYYLPIVLYQIFLWLMLSTTNNDPAVVVKHYLDTVVKLQGKVKNLLCTCVYKYDQLVRMYMHMYM